MFLRKYPLITSNQDRTMPPIDKTREYFDALVRRDPQYEGIVYYGIKTTGVFCRPTCTARKPNFENCEYFSLVANSKSQYGQSSKVSKPAACGLILSRVRQLARLKQ
jgi:AraC family transcriptional regulator of adaptative response/methylated-DNA-[protein]-cysteine methyltransferase